jgi:hypothetical protein
MCVGIGYFIDCSHDRRHFVPLFPRLTPLLLRRTQVTNIDATGNDSVAEPLSGKRRLLGNTVRVLRRSEEQSLARGPSGLKFTGLRGPRRRHEESRL